MRIKDSLKDTLENLKIDIDFGKFPEWWRLIHILRFYSLFPDARIFQSSGGGYHLLTKMTRSSSRLRRALGDCKGREYCANRRMEMIGSDSDIIFWSGKAKFQYKVVKGKLMIKWIRRRIPDREITLKDVLALPFWLKIDTHHRKSREKWLKRQKGKMKEMRRWCINAHRSVC